MRSRKRRIAEIRSRMEAERSAQSKAERYVKLRYNVDDEKAKNVLKESIEEVKENLGVDEDAVYASLEYLTPLQAKLEQPEIYNKLLICNNNSELESGKLHWIKDKTGFITVDKPLSIERTADIYGFFGTEKVNEMLGGRKFKFIVSGECPWDVYMTHDGNLLENMSFINSVIQHLSSKGYWIIRSFPHATPKAQYTEEFRSNFINQIKPYGFIPAPITDVPFLKNDVNYIILKYYK